MKKSIIWMVLILCLLTPMAPAIPVSTAAADEMFLDAPDVGAAQEETNLETLGIQRGTELVVGSPIAMSGDFGTELWGNNSADMDARALLHGYETVCWARGEGLELNQMVVTGVRTAQADDGSVAYRLQFADGLYYCDGSRITARDYAFYFLLSGAPQLGEVGGTAQGMRHIVGYDAYQAGETNVLRGVRVLSDNMLEIQVTGGSFPYFYGLALLSAKPYPISQIAPGCEVMDDGEGAYIAGEFTAQLLMRSLLDPETGYQYAPKVTSGPYMLESYDKAANEARFVVNEYFTGNYEGQAPHIERLVFKHVDQTDMLDALLNGDIDLLNKVTDSADLRQALGAAAQEGARAISPLSYLRTGFSFLAFACERSPGGSEAVRRAIAMSFDKDALVMDAMPDTAMRAYGYYGLGQWMASYSDEGGAAGQEPLDVTARLLELDVLMDMQGAAALLEADGWTLNERGEAYVSGQDVVRYRDSDGALEPLTIRWAMTKGNQMAARVSEVLTEALPSLGIELRITEMPFPEVLRHYYRQTDREYDMFFMASNFSYIFDPYYDFNTASAYQGVVNTSGLRDERLMQLSLDMRETDPKDLRGYVEKWLLFQERFAELMPMVPLYSNVYYDFVTDELGNYDISGNSGWSYAVTYAYMRDHDGDISSGF